MSVIFLTENNSLSKKVLKNPFSEKTVSIFEIPFKKMKKRASLAFKDRVSKSGNLFLAEPSLKALLPDYGKSIKPFFDSAIIKTAKEILKVKKLSYRRFVIHNPSKESVLSALIYFPDTALYGDNSLSIANSVYRETGASIPIISETSITDAVLCTASHIPALCAIAFVYDIKTSEKTFGGDSIKFYPEGDYAVLTALIRRPLTLEEASLLSEYDRKATFNIAF